MNQVLIIIIVVVVIIVIAATVISTAVTGQSNRPVSSPDDQPCRTPVPNSRSPPDPLLAQRRTVSTVPSASDRPIRPTTLPVSAHQTLTRPASQPPMTTPTRHNHVKQDQRKEITQQTNGAAAKPGHYQPGTGGHTQPDQVVFFAGMLSEAGLGTNQDWTRVWQVNVMSNVYAAPHALLGMLRRGEGDLISTASSNGITTSTSRMVRTLTCDDAERRSSPPSDSEKAPIGGS
jgi:hypothetical protein